MAFIELEDTLKKNILEIPDWLEEKVITIEVLALLNGLKVSKYSINGGDGFRILVLKNEEIYDLYISLREYEQNFCNFLAIKKDLNDHLDDGIIIESKGLEQAIATMIELL